MSLGTSATGLVRVRSHLTVEEVDKALQVECATRTWGVGLDAHTRRRASSGVTDRYLAALGRRITQWASKLWLCPGATPGPDPAFICRPRGIHRLGSWRDRHNQSAGKFCLSSEAGIPTNADLRTRCQQKRQRVRQNSAAIPAYRDVSVLW
jgi:hypothetical protein